MFNIIYLPNDSIIAFDKAYINYAWFCLLCAKGLFFVTRLKDNAAYKLLERRMFNRKNLVTSDHIIEGTHRGKALRLCHVGYRDAKNSNYY